MTKARSNARVLVSIATAGLFVASSLALATPADAVAPAPTTQTTTTVNAACLKAVQIQAPNVSLEGATNFCTVVTTRTVTTAATTAAVSNAALATPAAAGSVHSISWSESQTSILGLWQETQKGTAYYDGSEVWSTVSHRGYTGTHHCLYGWRYGYTITSITCSYTTIPNHHILYEIDDFRVAAIVEGSPVSWSYGQKEYIDLFGDLIDE